MLKHKIAITQRNYIELAYLGDKHSLEELEGEERAELPEGFEDWPVDECSDTCWKDFSSCKQICATSRRQAEAP
jgi:hypothetical protein